MTKKVKKASRVQPEVKASRAFEVVLRHQATEAIENTFNQARERAEGQVSTVRQLALYIANDSFREQALEKVEELRKVFYEHELFLADMRATADDREFCFTVPVRGLL